MFGPIKSVLFDLDGTLVHSMPHTVKGLLEAIKIASGEEIPLKELAEKGFGKVPNDIIKVWAKEENLPQAMKFWTAWEDTFELENYQSFSGIPELLRGLKEKNIFMGIVTGRDRKGTEKIIELHQWMPEFFELGTIRCGDDGPKPKPEPDLLLDLIEKYSLEPESTLMIGDLPMDVLAGKAAGVKTAAVLWDTPHDPALFKTHRSHYREVWNKWEGIPCDVRLNSPLSLLNWIA